MSRYEMFLLGGAAMMVLGVMMFFSAATKDHPLQKSIAMFALGGGLLYLADQNTAHGLSLGDIPHTIYRFVQVFF